MIQRDQIPEPLLPEEEALMEGFPDTVLVRGLDALEMLQHLEKAQDGAKDNPGILLSKTVLADDGLPVYTVAQWYRYARKYPDEFARVLNIALRVSGLLPDDAEKK